MADSAVLQMLNATPEEQAALRKIAMLRSAGISDSDIFANLADPNFTQAGGAGFLPYITDLAGISSSYNLGRGNIALQAQQDEYQRQGNPYNVVTALQNMRDTGNSAVLSDPMLSNVQQGPASIYSNYIKSLFSDGPQTAATTGTVASPQSPPAVTQAQQKTIMDAYKQNPALAEQFFSRASGAQPRPLQDVFGGMYGQTAQTAAQQPTNAETGAQSAAARLVGGSIKAGVGNQFLSTLNQGQIPGFSSINERQMGLLSPDQQQSYMGLVGSTGRVSDPQAAYASFLRQYGMGGSYQPSRTAR